MPISVLALCLQVFRRLVCHLSTFQLIWFLAALMLCRAQGKDTQFPCVESRKHSFWSGHLTTLIYAVFICLHELFNRVICLEDWEWFFLLSKFLFSKTLILRNFSQIKPDMKKKFFSELRHHFSPIKVHNV